MLNDMQFQYFLQLNVWKICNFLREDSFNLISTSFLGELTNRFHLARLETKSNFIRTVSLFHVNLQKNRSANFEQKELGFPRSQRDVHGNEGITRKTDSKVTFFITLILLSIKMKFANNSREKLFVHIQGMPLTGITDSRHFSFVSVNSSPNTTENCNCQ